MNKEFITKSVLIMLVVFLGSIILVRSLSGGETLLEYAEKNNIPIHAQQSNDDSEVTSEVDLNKK